MRTQDKVMTPTVFTIQHLATLDRTQLVDLLQQKTQLLIAARKSGSNYIGALEEEVKLIQAVLLERD